MVNSSSSCCRLCSHSSCAFDLYSSSSELSIDDGRLEISSSSVSTSAYDLCCGVEEDVGSGVASWGGWISDAVGRWKESVVDIMLCEPLA